MSNSSAKSLCILGCGNLGTAILRALLSVHDRSRNVLPFDHFIACVRSTRSEEKLAGQLSQEVQRNTVTIFRNRNVEAVQRSEVVILGADPADVESVLTQPGLSQGLRGKLLISVVAGWTREKLEETLRGGLDDTIDYSGARISKESRVWVLRTLPNIAALVSQSLTAIEEPGPEMPSHYLELAELILQQIGRIVRVTPQLIDATTAVGGSTPAFFAVICDAMIDAAVAVGVPRDTAQTMIYQSMQGTAALLQSGVHPGQLKDQGTSPEGCTIGGLMVLEEGAVRGHVGRALREAVTVARLMGTTTHVNDTRR